MNNIFYILIAGLLLANQVNGIEDCEKTSSYVQSIKEIAVGVFTQNRLNREQVLTQMAKALVGQYFYYQQARQINKNAGVAFSLKSRNDSLQKGSEKLYIPHT